MSKRIDCIRSTRGIAMLIKLSCCVCRYCKMGLFSCCDVTNPAKETELLYGHRIGGMHGEELASAWSGGAVAGTACQ